MRTAGPIPHSPRVAGIDPASEPHLDRLADGALLLVRDADHDDRAAILSLGATCLDPLVRPRRLPGTTIGPVRRMVEIADGRRLDGVTIAAVDPHDGRTLGVAGFQLTSADAGEAPAWVLVSPVHRDRGVGTALLERLAEIGRDRGLERFTAYVRACDSRMLALIERVGGRRVPAARSRPGTTAIAVPLPDAGGLGVPLGATLWAIARRDLTPVVFDDAARGG